MRHFLFSSLCFLTLAAMPLVAQKKPRPEPSIKQEKGHLVYKSDDKGNRPLDYSYCGYHASQQSLPQVAAMVYVEWKEGDNTLRIQRAIDYVSSLPADASGHRGAVLVGEGVFEVSAPLVMHTSGVVLRGSGREKTTLLRRGVDRAPAIKIEGVYDYKTSLDTSWVTGVYVPLGAQSLAVSDVSRFKVGQSIAITRPCTREWIESLGCQVFGGGIDALGWKPGDMDLTWRRVVTEVKPGEIVFDAPLTMALSKEEGQCFVRSYEWKGLISEVGVEAMTLCSDFEKGRPKDEDHCWTGISVTNSENSWVCQVDFRHFAGSAVIVQPSASRITIEDCRSYEPVSEVGGMRRRTFYTLGQQTLVQRCYAEHGINDFAVGYCAPGPNAFVQCEAFEALGFSGAISSWATGILYDVVDIDGHNLTFANLGQNKNGAGWNAANSLFWQCTAAEIECYSPTSEAQNRAYGCWAQFSGNGEWFESNNHIKPRSIYYAQLGERLGKNCEPQGRILPRGGEATSSPTVEQAMAMTIEARSPRLTLENWIAQAEWDNTLTAHEGLKEIDQIKENRILCHGGVRHKALVAQRQASQPSVYALNHGVLSLNGGIITGIKHDAPWWSGRLKPNYLHKAKAAVTRFVPDREGYGLTDYIDSVVVQMNRHGMAAYEQIYGLWYERRRDDHERIRRRDGDVWGPFYEQPFARSGEGTAWDGLSRYDLTRPNLWYYARLKEFAEKAAPQGILLYNEHFFQHNILEAGAHWVDSPWRTTNNINDTQFPEPVPFAGDKRIFIAEYFYDVEHPVRRELMRGYIRQQLDAFADCPNVVHLVSAEYTGPLHFVQFWVDVIAEWETETGKSPLIALAATKDVQDAILADERRAAIIDIIDIRYWHYNTDGLWAPEGGKNMAPRQHMRKMKVGKTTFVEAYKAVSEYRRQYPNKAVTFYSQNYPALGWAVAMAGGSCANIRVSDNALRQAMAKMQPTDIKGGDEDKMLLSSEGALLHMRSSSLALPLAPGKYRLHKVSGDGSVRLINKKLTISSDYSFAPEEGRGIYWFEKI